MTADERLAMIESRLARMENRLQRVEVGMAVINTDIAWIKKAFWALVGVGLPALLGIAIVSFTR
jgi:hypothetical protein